MFDDNKNYKNQKWQRPTIGALYSDYAPEEQVEAEATLKRYLNLVWRIYSRVCRENPEKLTEVLLNARFKRPRRPNQ